MLSLVPRLSTWRCPQLARWRQLSIDICRPRPSYGNQLRVAAAFDRRDRQTDRQTDGHRAAAASVNSQCAVHVQYRLRRASWWRSWCREDATTCGPCTTVWWILFHAELARRPTAACSRANLRPYKIYTYMYHTSVTDLQLEKCHKSRIENRPTASPLTLTLTLNSSLCTLFFNCCRPRKSNVHDRHWLCNVLSVLSAAGWTGPSLHWETGPILRNFLGCTISKVHVWCNALTLSKVTTS